jgi:hypothetical protein
MSRGEFASLKEALTLAEGRAEIDRIARALHAKGDLPSAMRQYSDDFELERPSLVMVFRDVGPDDNVKIHRAVAKTDPNPIRPGDWVALERWYAEEHGSGGYGDVGGARILTRTVPTADVAWAGTSADEWIYAPAECRNPEMSVHEFLVAYAMDRGLHVPPRVAAEYGH